MSTNIKTNIKVRKPFQPTEEEERKGKKRRSSKPQGEERELHPEYEEKPVVEPASKTSEDFHGGDELTFSMQESSQPSEKNEEQNSSSGSSSSGIESEEEQKDGGGQGEQEKSEGGEASDEEGEEREGSGEKREEEGESEEEGVGEEGNEEEEENKPSEGHSDNEEGEKQEEMGENGEDNEGENESNGEEGGEENKSNEEEEGENSEDGEGEDSEYEEDSEEEDEEYEYEDNDEQGHSYQYNTQQAFDIDLFPNEHKIKHYQTEFYRFLEMIAEDKTKIFDPYSAEEYNVKKLMFRQFERKPLSSYRMSKVRDSVVLILDNSGSMVWWSNNISLLADLAMDRNDVEIYLAPNGEIEEMIAPKRKHVSHNKVMQRLKGRKIIYVGDFDGADTPIELSWQNDVIWICPESRYERFEEHDWVHYNESDYKGAFLRVFDLDQMFNAFKKVLSNPKIWVEEPKPE